MSDFKAVSDLLTGLCRKYKVPVPTITLSQPSDKCDYTSHDCIRVNVDAAPEVPSEYHALHLFGHYLCELHYTNMADDVADIIAYLVKADRENEYHG